MKNLKQAIASSQLGIEKRWGEQIEDRRDPNETKRVVETVIACLGKSEPPSAAPVKAS